MNDNNKPSQATEAGVNGASKPSIPLHQDPFFYCCAAGALVCLFVAVALLVKLARWAFF